MYQSRLLLQMLVVRPFHKLLLYRAPDPLLHLRRRCLGKRHDQQTVHIDRMPARSQHRNDSLYQNRRLTRTCGGRYQNIPVSQIYNPLLVLRPLNTHT